MMLPLAPAKRTSWIRMPPEVCVRWASHPPARIRSNPAIANDHRLRMVAPPSPEPLSRLLGRFAGSFWLCLIPYPKGERAQAAALQRSVEVLTENERASLTLLFCLRNATGQAIEYGRRWGVE